MERSIASQDDLSIEAERFLATISPQTGGATLITLSGELGAGKTAFTKAIAKTLGIEETVTSPTFVLEKIYLIRNLEDSHSNGEGLLGSETPKFKRLIHIDAYRLEQGSDLAPLGFDELMQDAENLILLEWPEKVSDALLVPAIKISITPHTDGSRTISYSHD